MRFVRLWLYSAFLAAAQIPLAQAQDSIWEAAIKGDVDAIEAFIDDGVDLDELSESGSAPLHYAVARSRVDVVALLLDADADPDLEDSRQRTPLDLAIASNKMEIIDLLLEAGAGVDAPTTPLHPIVWDGDLLGVKLHIYAGTNIDQEDEFGNFPLLLAVEKGYLDIVDLFDSGTSDKERAAAVQRVVESNEGVAVVTEEPVITTSDDGTSASIEVSAETIYGGGFSVGVTV